MFTVRQVCEKDLVNGKDLFWASMDLEKAYGTIDGPACSRCWRKIFESGAEFLIRK